MSQSIIFTPAFRSIKTKDIVISPKVHDVRSIPKFKNMTDKQFLSWVLSDNDEINDYMRDNWEEGFVDNNGKYYSRQEASVIVSSLRGEHIPGESHTMRDYGLISKALSTIKAELVKTADILDKRGFIFQANVVDRLIKVAINEEDISDVKAVYGVHDEIIHWEYRPKEYNNAHTIKAFINIVTNLLRKVQKLVHDKNDKLSDEVRDFCDAHLIHASKQMDDAENDDSIEWKRVYIEVALNDCHLVLEELLTYFKEGKEFKGIIV